MSRQGPRRYAVLHRYSSGEHGPWEQGTTVELTPADAAWVNRDSPGTLAEVKPGVKLITGQPVPPSKLLGHPDPQPPAAAEPEPAPKAAEPEPAPPAAKAEAPKDDGARHDAAHRARAARRGGKG